MLLVMEIKRPKSTSPPSSWNFRLLFLSRHFHIKTTNASIVAFLT